MADVGRCTTDYTSSRLANDALFAKAGIAVDNNLAYRMYIQGASTDDVVPAATTCGLFDYSADKDFDTIESTNVISQLLTRKA